MTGLSEETLLLIRIAVGGYGVTVTDVTVALCTPGRPVDPVGVGSRLEEAMDRAVAQIVGYVERDLAGRGGAGGSGDAVL